MERDIRINIDVMRFELAGEVEEIGLRQAIGYFSCYGFNSFDHVSISHDGTGLDLYAVFSRKADNRQFVIGAIWDKEKKRYSFHS